MAKKGTLKEPVRVMRKALKFASRDASRAILCGVHLAENGDVVSTDSYRMFVESGAWDGPEMTVDYATAYDISKCKLKGNETSEFELKAGKLTVTMADGTEITGAIAEGNYPNYGQLFEGLDFKTTAHMNPKQVLPVVKEHARSNANVKFEVAGRDLHVIGLAEQMPTAKFDKACDGDDVSIGFDSKFARDALEIFGDYAELHIMKAVKPAVFTDGKDVSVLVMPVRLNAETPSKKERKHAPKVVDREKVMTALHHAAIDRAASDPDGKVQQAPCTADERNLLFALDKDGRLKKEKCGDLMRYELDGKFLCCIERRWSKRKIHLTYPELKPTLHKDDVVTARKVEEKAQENVDVKVSEHADVTAIEIAPKKEATDEEEEQMKERIAELEKQLTETRKELEDVWKENETLKATKKAPKTPKAPKVEKKPAKPAEKAAEMPTVVSLEAMQEWCKERNLVATQKREGTCIWIEGESKPFKAELMELGFRFAKKRKSWYFDPKKA